MERGSRGRAAGRGARVAAAVAIVLLAAGSQPGCERVERICRINQAWPCTCDRVGEECRDGSLCVNLAVSFPQSAPAASPGETGYCAPSCEDPAVDRCPKTEWGLGTLCWTETYTDEIYLCILYCESDGDCPPGQECTTGSYCHPLGE